MVHMVEYYRQRAVEYEKIYDKPERQKALVELKRYLGNIFKDQDVLEIACGSGYWTQLIASTARSVLAVDINQEMLQIAQAKEYPQNNTQFILDDAYALNQIVGSFTMGFAAFWWSHIPKQQLKSFLDNFHKKIGSKNQVVFIDNLYVEGSSTPISYADKQGNTYQERRLENRNSFQILKNFPTEKELFETVADQGRDMKYLNFQYYWCFSYQIA